MENYRQLSEPVKRPVQSHRGIISASYFIPYLLSFPFLPPVRILFPLPQQRRRATCPKVAALVRRNVLLPRSLLEN